MLYRQEMGKIIIQKDPVAIVTENIQFMQGVCVCVRDDDDDYQESS